MSETTGEHTGVKITSEKQHGLINSDKVATSLPGPLGSGAGVFKAVQDSGKDGKVDGGEIATIATSGAGFVSSCMDVAGIAADPIGWLVGQGLNFLLNVVQPFQDLIHTVSGDGPALANAAGNFGNIGQGLVSYSQKFAQEAQESLADWTGPAAEQAATKLAEFSNGIKGIAGQAGDIAQLLQISSMIMTVIEEFIKALLTELITWLIMIWIPALAAAVPTAGGSTAAAGTATGVKGAATATKATKQVSKLQRLLDKIQEFLAKAKQWFGELKTNFKQVMDTKAMQSSLARLETEGAKQAGTKAGLGARLNNADGGMVGSRVSEGFGSSMGTAAKKAAARTVGLGNGTDEHGDFKAPGDAKKAGQLGSDVANKANTYGQGVNKAREHGSIGTDQSKEETSDDLDF